MYEPIFNKPFIAFMVVAIAVAGWAVIELLLWALSFFTISFTG